VVAVAVVALAACDAADRPEGTVERWLVSLNQGAAGRPDRFAAEALSDELLPGWDEREPGDLDLIEVGRAVPTQDGHRVPFRIVTAEGGVIRGWATTQDGTVVAVERPEDPSEIRVPSDGGARPPGAGGGAWLLAIALGVVVAALAFAVVGVIDRRATRRSPA
jgi:hypothetical protein